ncbi:MAG: FtsQ-type POTRA domain-containing protein [Desulfobacterales bacterium]|nr:FtsQ-type POTRA domain-containing protein [Desulfobacterales bacterium]
MSLLRLIIPVLMVAAMSLTAIYAHDAVVQSPFFTIRTIEISGTDRVSHEELITRAGLDQPANLFDIRLTAIEKQLISHPWVARATVSRDLFTALNISIEEQEPLAIVTIENLADIIINTQGVPFKEYEPAKDNLSALPVISGVDLSLSNNTYLFEGELFNAIMDLLEVQSLGEIKTIHGDENIGITIKALDIYNKRIYTEAIAGDTPGASALIPIKLGFNRFEEKLLRAKKISRYMEAQFPSKTILAMDLFNIEKIFIKTEDALHNTLEKGV